MRDWAKLACAVTTLLLGTGQVRASTIAYWRFEEGAADVAATNPIIDSSGNSLSGNPVGGPVFRTSVGVNPVPHLGLANTRSLDFNGSTQRISLPDYAALALTQSMTVEAWIFSRTTNNGNDIIMRGDDRRTAWIRIVCR